MAEPRPSIPGRPNTNSSGSPTPTTRQARSATTRSADAGNEYAGLLPSQDLVQQVADYGFIVRCQIQAAANALGP